MNNAKVLNNNVILFDEAQRAWDEEKIRTKGLTELDVIKFIRKRKMLL